MPAMLKLSWPGADTKAEAAALDAWAGRGAVRLLARDDAQGVLLLERLGSSLQDHPDANVAASLAGAVLARLHAVEAPAGVPSLAALASQQLEELPLQWRRLGEPFSERILSASIEDYRSMGSGNSLLHGDFHFANVLERERSNWAAIDPIPLSGERGYDVLPLLRNRFGELDGERGLRRRFDAVVDAAGLDRERALACTIARAADDALWFRAHDRRAETEIADHLLTALASWR